MSIEGPKVEERVPVRSALSELFLDTRLQDDDRERIAKTLADSPYSEKKLEAILRFEVTPVLKANLMGVAGEWAGFDEAWMRADDDAAYRQASVLPFRRFLDGAWSRAHILRRVALHKGK